MTGTATADNSETFPNRFPVTARSMGIGLMMPTTDEGTGGRGAPRFRDLAALARQIEASGFDSLWVPDHFVYRYPGAETVYGVWEAWTLLAGLAAVTEQVSLSVFVTGLVFRNPGVVAKAAEMLDEISNGRFILGLGAGSRRPDFDLLGLPYDHRASRSEEAVRIISALLRDGYADVRGTYYQANDAWNLPRGPRAATGGPPILIGTRGPRMLELTARFADAWNGDWHQSAESVRPLLTACDDACRAVGRDPQTLVRTAGCHFVFADGGRRHPAAVMGDRDFLAETIAGFRELGLRHFIAVLDPCTPETVEQFARVLEMVDATDSALKKNGSGLP